MGCALVSAQYMYMTCMTITLQIYMCIHGLPGTKYLDCDFASKS